MGFKEVLGKYNFFKNKIYDYIEFIKTNDINNVIMVDYGGFNLAFLKILKREIKDINVFYYIPPKLWVWGKWRMKKLALADHILAIFPWEEEFYRKNEVRAVYFGNPLVDINRVVSENGEKILLLPGSRKQELEEIVPVMNKIAENMPNKKFLLKAADEKLLYYFTDMSENIEITTGTTLEECAYRSYCAVAASGTVTLELALMGVPSVVVYKTSLFNEIVAKMILKIKYVSLPNIVKNEEIFKELLQKDMKYENIIKEIENIENNYDIIKSKLSDIRDILGKKKCYNKICGIYFKKQ
jgi:lipid-A-disaccharide synthase